MAGRLPDGIDTGRVSLLHHVVHDGFSDMLSAHRGAAFIELLSY